MRADKILLDAHAMIEPEEERVLLEPSDVAASLGLSASSVRRLEDAGVITVAARTPRGLRLFDQREVERARAVLAVLAEERGRRRHTRTRRA